MIRAAAFEDAERIGKMAGEFADYLRSLGDDTDFKFDAAAYRRDGFGPNAAFAGLVAELDGALAGYLLYHFGYDVDRASRIMHVVDLWVAPKAAAAASARR